MPIPRGPVERARALVAARRRDRARVKAEQGDSQATWDRWFGAAPPTMSGVTVTETTAMRVTAVLSCVKVIAESISTLPLMVFERDASGDKRAAPEHPLSEVLHLLSNEETTAQSLRETLCAHVLLRGTAFARIARDGAGDVRELWPIAPSTLRVERNKRSLKLEFHVSETGTATETLRPDQVWRIPGLSWCGATGLSPIGLARESVGLAMALEHATASSMKNGARLAGVVSHPGTMDEDEYKRFKESWNETYTGIVNAGKTAILEAGAKFEPVGMTFDDLQFIELKKFQVAEIARLFRVPLHMLFDDHAQPRANMEQASLEFVVYTLRPWLVRFEQTIARDLLLPAERARYFAEHNVAGLLRGDFAARMAGYAQGRQWGWWSVNDIRRLENLNGIGDEGDVYLQPSNMVPAGDVPAPEPPTFDPPEEV
jgi:HK97 family phage portal protein